MSIPSSTSDHQHPKIAIFAIGGAGVNTLNELITTGVTGCHLFALDTDKQSLGGSLASSRIVLGTELCKGLGSGADPKNGTQAAMATKEQLSAALSGYELIYIIAGMGGGTGGGASIVLAQLAKAGNIRTIAICTRPFAFEGKRRRRNAEQSIGDLCREVDLCIVVPQQQLLSDTELKIMHEIYQHSSRLIVYAVTGMLRIQLNKWVESQQAIQHQGLGYIGMATASGTACVEQALKQAAVAPTLADVSLRNVELMLAAVMTGQEVSESQVSTTLKLLGSVKTNILTDVMQHDMMPEEARAVIVVAGCKKQYKQDPVIARTYPKSNEMAGGSPSHGVGGAFSEEQRRPRLWRVETPSERGGKAKDEESSSDE